MPEIFCTLCGEPWDLYYVSHELHPLDRPRFLPGAGFCPEQYDFTHRKLRRRMRGLRLRPVLPALLRHRPGAGQSGWQLRSLPGGPLPDHPSAGVTIHPAATLSDLVRNLQAGTLLLSLDEKGEVLTVQADQSKAKVKGIAACFDDPRPVLTGVLFELEGDRLTLSSADGFRLSTAWEPLAEPVAEPRQAIVPASRSRR